MQAAALITRANDILQDLTEVRWTLAEKLRWLSDMQRTIVLYLPEAHNINGAIPLVGGATKQTLPPAALQLIRLTCNLGADGLTPGRAIRLVDREILDAQVPTWHTDAAGTEIKHYVFDKLDPKTFYVYPRPASALQVGAVYSTAPAELTAPTDTLALDDSYAGPLLDGLLYRCYSKDAEYAKNPALAATYYQSFVAALGIRSNVASADDPNANSTLNPAVAPGAAAVPR